MELPGRPQVLDCRAKLMSGGRATRALSSCAAREPFSALSGGDWDGRGRRGSWARRFEYEDPFKAAEREERDRRRAEVRRYPIDDTELHAELRDKAFSDGAPPTSYGKPKKPAQQAPQPAPAHIIDRQTCTVSWSLGGWLKGLGKGESMKPGLGVEECLV